MRWASILAGPTEFWTISAWDSRHHMQEFMRSEAHGRWMWRFSDWLSSFWLMRWRPGGREIGDWDGLPLAACDDEPGGLDRGTDVPREVLLGLRERIPALYEALGPDGAASYGAAGSTRLARRYVAGAGGAIVRVEAATIRLPLVLAELNRVRRQLESDDRLVGCAVGLGRRHEAFLLAVWRDRDAVPDLLDADWVQEVRQRDGLRLWASEWVPESEFGHWDGRRLRRERSVQRDPAGGHGSGAI